MLEGKVAIITGGTRGIGLAIVKKFLENGAKVALLGSKEESVTNTLNELKEQEGKVIGFYPDLTNMSEVKETFQKVVDSFGKIDILVNNAGLSSSTKIEE